MKSRFLVQKCVAFLFLISAIPLSSGCGNTSQQNTHKSTLVTPKDPKPITVVAGQATTMDLGGGADLIIPPGAVTAGATIHATYQGTPGGKWTNDIAPTFAPVQLISDPADAIHGLLFLEFPIPVDQITPGIDPAVQFGISTFDQSTGEWVPYTSTYDAARHMVVAQIPHFSWWNPFTWDFGSLFKAVTQGFGQLIGTRAGPATCKSSPPNWVTGLVGISNDAGVAIRDCAQSDGDNLDVEFVNNRPYGQVLTYGSNVKWHWREDPQSLSENFLDQIMDAHLAQSQLYLPPLGRASVGILKPDVSTPIIFSIEPSAQSIGLDLGIYILGTALDTLLPKFSDIRTLLSCGSFPVNAPLRDFSLGGLRDDLLAVLGCIKDAVITMVKQGIFDGSVSNKLAALFGKLKGASLVGDGIELATGVIWRITDYVADLANIHNLAMVNGFGFSAKQPPTVTPPTVTPVPPPTVTPVQPPTVTPVPPPTVTPVPPQYYETTGPGPVHTWSNYTNAGGTAGATIGANQKVQISCRLTGFKVADGNTWWYRLASAPWNNSFYASADAFYNNGQTSGSLNGTPFVDPSVPNC